MMTRRSRLIARSLLTLAAATTLIVTSTQPASALSGSDFKAGRIMDTTVFFNSAGLSPGDIQNFFNSKVPSCDTNGTRPYSGTTAAAYGTSRGYPPPYTCIKDYRMDTTTKSADSYCGTYYGGTNKSAAEIIYDVSQSCGVNPKMLIVLLQKEQGLITDNWPWSLQYRKAMGFACPDTAACDSAYFGFFNQVYAAAKQFKKYAANPNSYNHIAKRNNNVRFSPTVSCGTSSVYIENQATAGLYNYTPYQPNQAALNNLYGTGDSCSAYGNRNFWRYYNDWFGMTYAPNFSWNNGGFRIMDKNKTVYLDPGQLSPGETYTVILKAVNMGNFTWSNTGFNPILLGTAKSEGRNSSLCTSSWVACNRPALLKESSVEPLQTGTFEFTIRAPMGVGSYREHFKPVAEMLSWFGDSDESLGIRVVSPGSFTWSTSGYRIMDTARTAYVDPGQLQPGQRYLAILSATNTGSATWKNTGIMPVTLATSMPSSRTSMLCNNSWEACNRPALLKESSTAPGQTGTFEFEFNAPYKPGNYREYFRPVAEYFSWFNEIDPHGSLGIRVVDPGSFSWTTTGYKVMNAGKTAFVDPGQLQAGQRYVAILSARNTGTATWKNTGTMPMSLGTSMPTSRTSSLCNNTWPACNRAAMLKETSVAPGQTGTFEFAFDAPSTPGNYREYFKPVAEYYTWLSDIVPDASLGIRVQ